jgi:hypothetical protein
LQKEVKEIQGYAAQADLNQQLNDLVARMAEADKRVRHV